MLEIFSYKWSKKHLHLQLSTLVYKLHPLVCRHLLTFSWLKLIGIWVAFGSGIIEEILFRQILMNWFMSLNEGVII